FQTIKWALSAVVISNWHPLTLLSHILDWSLFGANAAGHHLVSLFLHIGSIIFLFLFLNKTTHNLWAAAFAATFFALHPLRVESVAWASERKDVLSMFFGMASIYVYAFYTENHKLSKYFLCLMLFSLSLMSKSMFVTLPFVLLLLDYWPLERWQNAKDAPAESIFKIAGRLLCEKIPFFFLTIAVSIITFWAQNKELSVASESILPFPTRAANAIVSFSSYLVKTIYPINLSIYYPYDFYLPLWKVLISATILILITATVFYFIRKLPFLFVGWSWYLGTLIPVIGLVQVGTQSMADRYTYLPSIGIAVMLAWGFSCLIENYGILKKIMLPMTLALLIIISVLTWNQCGYWKNSYSLFKHAVKITKDNYIAHERLAAYLVEKGNFNAAIYHYNKAISIKTQPILSYAGNYIDRGNTYAKLAMYQLAIEDFNKAIKIKPDSADSYYARGTTYGRFMGQYKMAIDDLNKLISLKPDYVDAYINRGLVWDKLGLYQKAIDDFNEAIKIKPDYANAWNNRAYVYLNQKNFRLGCLDAIKACDLGNCKVLELAKRKGSCS
ncbi:MAG TPA: tetratricopeptide repeat protein, partial [Smithellaceae bacterium]|nr:tetratricopeptide repeat protein [Smithellaceae bacterium]